MQCHTKYFISAPEKSKTLGQFNNIMNQKKSSLLFDFNKKPVFALGSAPGASPPPGKKEDWEVITINGSQASLEKLGLETTPTATIFNTSLIKTKYNVNVAARKVLRGCRTENLVVLSGSTSFRKKLHVIFRLLMLNYRYKTLSILSTSDRISIMEDILRMKLPEREQQPSNGIFTVLLALHLGAERVLMSGFSLSKQGHAYNNLNFKRAHTTGDLLTLRRAVEVGLPIFTNDEEFSKESGIPLIENV